MTILKNLRNLLALLVLTLTPAMSGSLFAQTVTVVEFYNKTLDAYFITGRSDEQQSLDASPDFRRTGMSFDALTASVSNVGVTRICRYYISLSSPFTRSHFYGREVADCDQIRALNLPGFSYEGYDFSVAEPTGGVCPTGTTTVYRGFRPAVGGKTPNHRYATSPETYVAAQNLGYVAEGAVFCAASATDVIPTVPSTQKCGTFFYPGKRIAYQSLTADGSASSFNRFLNNYSTVFHGNADATPVTAFSPGIGTLLTMIADRTSSWTILGTGKYDDVNFTYSEVYYSNPTTYPRDYALGQSVLINTVLTYSDPNGLGIVTQTGKVTYVGIESIGVPLGTFPSTCKFVTELVTTYGESNETTTTLCTDWVADSLGIVKTVNDTQSVQPSKPTVRVITTSEGVSVQPL